MTDFWGKADISPGVRQNMGLVRFIPELGVAGLDKAIGSYV